MAIRPVYYSERGGRFLVRVEQVSFEWYAGMSKAQRQKSVRSLHTAASEARSGSKLLEVSSLSETELGVRLSAFNLCLNPERRGAAIPVECLFQSGKVFEFGGPYTDLLHVPPLEAKRDPRLQESGRLVKFTSAGQDWALEPPTAFYDWIYLNTLHRNPVLAEEVMNWNGFTDIVFNPIKSVNCQAGAVALYVALRHRGILEDALSSRESYLNLVSAAEGVRDTQSDQIRLL